MNQLSPAPSWIAQRPIAHRGYHDLNASRPENSLAAIMAAAQKGFAVECDLQMSSTGVPVVFHDPTLNRMANRSGYVREMSPAELAKVNLLGTNQVIETLETVLRHINGTVPLILELKGNRGEDDGFVPGLADCLRDYSGQAAVMSFDHWLCAQFRDALPNIPRGLTAQGNARSYDGHIAAMHDYDLQFVSYKVQDVDCHFVREMRALGLPVITWTVKDERARQWTRDYADQMTFEGFDPRDLVHG